MDANYLDRGQLPCELITPHAVDACRIPGSTTIIIADAIKSKAIELKLSAKTLRCAQSHYREISSADDPEHVAIRCAYIIACELLEKREYLEFTEDLRERKRDMELEEEVRFELPHSQYLRRTEAWDAVFGKNGWFPSGADTLDLIRKASIPADSNPELFVAQDCYRKAPTIGYPMTIDLIIKTTYHAALRVQATIAHEWEVEQGIEIGLELLDGKQYHHIVIDTDSAESEQWEKQIDAFVQDNIKTDVGTLFRAVICTIVQDTDRLYQGFTSEAMCQPVPPPWIVPAHLSMDYIWKH